MQLHFAPILVLLGASALADTFGSGPNQFGLGFANIGSPGNVADGNGRGAVGYEYRMGVNEVSRGMIESYNTQSGGPSITMSDMAALGGNGTGRPATGVSWNEAARFVNWLNTSSGHSAAYKFTTGGANDSVSQWGIGDAGYDPSNPFRNTNARYYLPSLNEWYKAAYYDPNAGGGSGGYWNFATGSDTLPTAVAGGTTSGTAVYSQGFGAGPADATNAGGLSPFGTMGQAGNVAEWTESYINQSGDYWRAYLGGTWNTNPTVLTNQSTLYTTATAESFSTGFRIASLPVPEPSGVLLVSIGILGMALGENVDSPPSE